MIAVIPVVVPAIPVPLPAEPASPAAGRGKCRLRLRALHVTGHGPARIARPPGVRETTIRHLARGDTTAIRLAFRDAVTDLYEAWRDKRAPGRPDAVRGTVRNLESTPDEIAWARNWDTAGRAEARARCPAQSRNWRRRYDRRP